MIDRRGSPAEIGLLRGEQGVGQGGGLREEQRVERRDTADLRPAGGAVTDRALRQGVSQPAGGSGPSTTSRPEASRCSIS